MSTIESLYVPDIQPALKHPTVFKKFDALQSGQSFLLINDHDPIPLFYELKAERGNSFEWKKIENGPDVWKVEIRKTAAATAAPQASVNNQTSEKQEGVYVLNVTLIEPRLKHPTIFKQFDSLKPGEAFQILNDHDPKPLYYQMIAERGNVFTWEYLEKGPVWYKVQIRKNDLESGETVGEIAAKDLRKAEVFKKYGIDFCCGGKKSLKQACEEKGIDLAEVEAALDQPQATVSQVNDYNRWQPDFLADYIYNQHHRYYYDEAPVVLDLLQKVAGHHGTTHPFLIQLNYLFSQLVPELNTHFIKEERVVFPFIKALVEAKRTGNHELLHSQPSLTEPIQIMESDHEAAGEILEEIKEITDGFTPPASACNSFQLLYKKLSDLYEDMHQHIHLENNILFPKALSIEKELRG